MEKTTTVFIADSAEDFTSGLSAALQCRRLSCFGDCRRRGAGNPHD